LGFPTQSHRLQTGKVVSSFPVCAPEVPLLTWGLGYNSRTMWNTSLRVSTLAFRRASGPPPASVSQRTGCGHCFRGVFTALESPSQSCVSENFCPEWVLTFPNAFSASIGMNAILLLYPRHRVAVPLDFKFCWILFTKAASRTLGLYSPGLWSPALSMRCFSFVSGWCEPHKATQEDFPPLLFLEKFVGNCC
jgi:hypothetical protein